MNRNNLFVLALLLSLSYLLSPLQAQGMASIYEGSQFWESTASDTKHLSKDRYKAVFSISHGHCQTPYEALFNRVDIRYLGSGKNGPKIDFEVSANTFTALHEPNGPATHNTRGSGCLDANRHPTIRFVCKDSYFLGTDWYQMNGTITLRGESVPTSIHVRQLFDERDGKKLLREYVLDGQLNLEDFGILYDIEDGVDHGGRTMSMNMVLKTDGC